MKREPFVAWSDYHSGRIYEGNMQFAQMHLPADQYAALAAAAQPDPADARWFILPREAIERAATALPYNVAPIFLQAIYGGEADDCERLAAVIRSFVPNESAP